ncbi:MAG: hypothetical protein MUC89_15900 [Acetobacteraceae bacterium]|jgi:hypothetical protein|nr:hypothetical protein [Acetobacteraceae bacterium]
MPRISQYPAAGAAAGTDELVANQAGTTRKVTVTQLRNGLQPASSALTALAGVTGTGVMRRTGADAFTAGPLPLGQIEQGGAASGQVLKWNGSAWAPAADIAGTGGFTGDFAGGTASNYLVSVSDSTATAVTLATGQSGMTMRMTAASTVTVTLPASLPIGFNVTFMQAGAGQIQFVAAAGATLVNRSGHTRTAGQHAMVSVVVGANSGGSAAVWTLSGDTVA